MGTTIAEVRSPADWRGQEIAGRDDWKLRLEDVHRAEVLAALATVERQCLSLQDVARAGFPLPTLGPALRQLTGELMQGRGFALVQGIPVETLDESQCETVAVGVAAHLGTVLPQGADQALVLHVRDQGIDPERPTTRSYEHRRRLGYHADPNDIVSLLCLRPARSGGLSSIVSAVAVHNEIIRTRPDLATVLYGPWWFDRRQGDGPDSFFQQPVYAVDAAGQLVSRYGPDYMRSAQRGPQVPPLSEPQLAAMELLDELTNDPRFSLAMDLQAGDMQFLNNYVTLHSRTAFEDDPDPRRRRDLIRLWLSA
jgi:Taurine catabolism dioxygenase TauD, TfdA family